MSEMEMMPLPEQVAGPEGLPKPASESLPGLKKPFKLKRLILVVVGLVVVAIVGGWFMWGPSLGSQSGTAKPTPTLVPSPTEVPQSVPLTIEEMGVDSDSDSIPDKLEQLVGYDPQQNDCVREVGCGDFPTLPRAKLRLNLVFILDVSGSMGEKVGDVTKWQSAVSALTSVIQQGFTGFTDVSLVVYGHQGSSSSADQGRSCAGVEILSPLQPWSQTDIPEKIKTLSPRGWTPIGGALRKTGDMLKEREGEGNFVVVLSDGKETCGGDPVAVARELKEAGIEVTTNVVGLVVSDDEKQQLEAIAQAGGGKYFAANSPEELQRAIFLSSEVVRLWEQINQCIIQHLSEYGQCVNVQYLKSINYLRDRRLEMETALYPIEGTKSVLPEYVNLERRMWDKFEKLRDENWRQYLEDLGNLGLPRNTKR